MRPPLLLRSHAFSARLASRIFALTSAASLAFHASCAPRDQGAGTTGDTTPHGSGGGTTGSTGSTTTTSGASHPDSGPGSGTECLDWPADAGSCPTDENVVIFLFDENGCPDGGTDLVPSYVDSGPTRNEAGQCCYVVEYQWCLSGGRPLLVEGRRRVAPVVRAPTPGDWSRGAPPRIDDLTAADRAFLAEAWAADAQLEHASVASFSRFALALLAVGAPAGLVELAHRAALDEVRHAQRCFALAAAYAGAPVAPAPFPALSRIDVDTSLATLAASTVREGCVGETIAAIVAAEQHARALDPAVRAALAEIAGDEAAHAELAWRTVAWAIAGGGREVRDAVEEAFRDVLSSSPPAGSGLSRDRRTIEAHGRLDPATLAGVTAHALRDVVGPAARSLLEGGARQPG